MADMACLVCGGNSDDEPLCPACEREVTPYDGLIREHIRSTVPPIDADAWLVDGFGQSHAVTDRTMIGRSHERHVMVLSAVVGREHAELRCIDNSWIVRDLGSHNGTFVDGTRCQGRVALGSRALVKFGGVAMWFVLELHDTPLGPPDAGETLTVNDIVRFEIAAQGGGAELRLVGNSDASAGGSLLSRPPATTEWTERKLAPLEFQLLRRLCARALAEADSPAAVRGCVPTQQLARDLPFQSRFANDENVRQVVRRARAALAGVGADGVLAVVPGRGYYIASPVTVAGR